jgi:hypothetical protein
MAISGKPINDADALSLGHCDSILPEDGGY